jgi:hypothetical protein
MPILYGYHDSGRVLVGLGDPTIIMVLNGKISHLELEQIWLSSDYGEWHIINGQTTLAQNNSTL